MKVTSRLISQPVIPETLRMWSSHPSSLAAPGSPPSQGLSLVLHIIQPLQFQEEPVREHLLCAQVSTISLGMIPLGEYARECEKALTQPGEKEMEMKMGVQCP